MYSTENAEYFSSFQENARLYSAPPPLFLLLLNNVLETTNKKATSGKKKLSISERLNDMDYTDLYLKNHSLSEIKFKLKKLSRNGSKVGLRINNDKTKMMRLCAAIRNLKHTR